MKLKGRVQPMCNMQRHKVYRSTFILIGGFVLLQRQSFSPIHSVCHFDFTQSSTICCERIKQSIFLFFISRPCIYIILYHAVNMSMYNNYYYIMCTCICKAILFISMHIMYVCVLLLYCSVLMSAAVQVFPPSIVVHI